MNGSFEEKKKVEMYKMLNWAASTKFKNIFLCLQRVSSWALNRMFYMQKVRVGDAAR